MTELQKEAIEQTKNWIDLANEKYGTNIPYPTVNFNLKGRVAGKAFLNRNEIRYNAVLLEENGETFLKRTVPHEVAHIIVYKRFMSRSFNLFGQRPKAHGDEWKRIMRDFRVDYSRCHTYDTSNSRQYKKGLSREFEYKCNCTTFKLTITRHKRALKGAQYQCKKCKSVLKIA